MQELTLMIGKAFSGKTHYVKKNLLESHQLIDRNTIQYALEKEYLPKSEIYRIMAIIARSLMLYNVPIIVDDKNLNLESIFIWKSLAFEYGYTIKCIIIDTPNEICEERIEKLNISHAQKTDLKEVLRKEDLLFSSLVPILLIEEQSPVEKKNISIIHGGSKNEILQN
jgi:predicted kinase